MLNKVIKLLVVLILIVILLMLINELYLKMVVADAAVEYFERIQTIMDDKIR